MAESIGTSKDLELMAEYESMLDSMLHEFEGIKELQPEAGDVREAFSTLQDKMKAEFPDAPWNC